MSKILFVEPDLRTDKLGMLYLSAVLKAAGHEVDLVLGNHKADAEARCGAWRPDFVMYSAATGNHRWYFETNAYLKRWHDFKAICGGSHLTFFPDDGLGDPDIDYVVRGPAEDLIVDLVEHPERHDKLITGTVPDIESLPAPDRSILYQYPQFGEARMKRFMACRDCPNACTYCFNHLYHRIFKDQRGQFYQTTSPRKMVDEVLAVKKKWGLELAYFNDDNFARDHEWLTEFCRLFKDEVGIQFCGSVRADSLTEDVVRMMAWAGCSFQNIALESAVPSTQKLLRRGKVSNDHIRQACEWFDKYGVKVRLQNMVGLPVADPVEDALQTLEFNQSVPITDSWASTLVPFKNTDIWQHCIDAGLIDEDTDAMTFYDSTPLKFDEVTRRRIDAISKWWYYAVKWGMSRAAIMDLIDIPLADEQRILIQQARWAEAARVLYGLEG